MFGPDFQDRRLGPRRELVAGNAESLKVALDFIPFLFVAAAKRTGCPGAPGGPQFPARTLLTAAW